MNCALFVTHKIVCDPIARAPKLIVNVQDRAARVTEDRIHPFVYKGFH
jgi:hypothetical protein